MKQLFISLLFFTFSSINAQYSLEKFKLDNGGYELRNVTGLKVYDMTLAGGGPSFIMNKGKIGLINEEDLVVIIEPKYDEVEFWWEGMLKVKQNNKWGIINSQGEEIIPAVYKLKNLEYVFNDDKDEAKKSKDVRIKIKVKGGYVFYNSQGQEIMIND